MDILIIDYVINKGSNYTPRFCNTNKHDAFAIFLLSIGTYIITLQCNNLNYKFYLNTIISQHHIYSYKKQKPN